MKKFLALLLTLVMALSLAACGGSDEESTDSPAEDPAANEESSGSAADVKIGLICVHDINSGYDAAHIEGLTAACEELGIDANSQVIFRYNIAEDENCYDAAVDLAEEGCNIIFSDSYGHQSYMLDAAEDYPDVTFVSCTGDMAATSGLDNYKNLFPYTYESRYVSGVVAGMKLKELMDAGTVTDPKVGYVGAYPYAEVVCGYTAFLLGIQTQVPEAYMEVQYTNSWYDPVAEGEAANALMARGCVIIGRCASSILRDRKNVLSVFIYAVEADRVARIARRIGLDERDARARMRKMDRMRKRYFDFYADTQWGDPESYDVMLSSSHYGVDGCVDLLCESLQKGNSHE